MSSVELVQIPRDGLALVWPIVEPLLSKATGRTKKADTIDVLREAEIGTMQVWLAVETGEIKPLAACATEIVTYTSGLKSAKVLLIGGSQMRRWKHLLGKLEDWAKDEGCSSVEIVGRPGWEKVYPQYSEIERWFSKEI